MIQLQVAELQVKRLHNNEKRTSIEKKFRENRLFCNLEPSTEIRMR